jgi:hypothetical protein
MDYLRELLQRRGPPKLEIEQRKKLVLFNTSFVMMYSLKRLVNLKVRTVVTHAEEEDPKNKDICWMYRRPTKSQCRAGRICVRIQVDRNNIWEPNFGIASLLVNGKLTTEQKDGIIQNNWELSHLCGNWRCMNHHHYTIEPHSTNVRRNSCFKAGICFGHEPRCIIQLKVKQQLQ